MHRLQLALAVLAHALRIAQELGSTQPAVESQRRKSRALAQVGAGCTAGLLWAGNDAPSSCAIRHHQRCGSPGVNGQQYAVPLSFQPARHVNSRQALPLAGEGQYGGTDLARQRPSEVKICMHPSSSTSQASGSKQTHHTPTSMTVTASTCDAGKQAVELGCASAKLPQHPWFTKTLLHVSPPCEPLQGTFRISWHRATSPEDPGPAGGLIHVSGPSKSDG